MTTLQTPASIVTNPVMDGFDQVAVKLQSYGLGMLMNPMTSDILDELAGVKPKGASEKDMKLSDRAARRVLRENEEDDGKIGVPVTYLLGALVYAGRFVKNGKKQISTAKSTTLYEFLNIPDEFLPFTDQDEPMVVDKRRAVASNVGKTAGIAVIRPKFRKWELSFNIGIDTSLIGLDVVHQLFVEAGRKAGLGDYRPSTRGPFGMFFVSEWKKISS